MVQETWGEFQNGFRPERRVVDHVLPVNSRDCKEKQEEEGTYMASLDIHVLCV